MPTLDMTSSPPTPARSWQMFDQISNRYDRVNRVLSLGMDTAWRRRLVNLLAQDQPRSLCDLATGTGDVLIAAARALPDLRTAVGLDLSENMLAVARQKLARAGLSGDITLMRADLCRTTLPDAGFDAVTMAFGIRNVPAPPEALKEVQRILRPGGRALIMEFSLPANPVLRLGVRGYLRAVVPTLGGLLSGQFAAYRYLGSTIEHFAYGDEFCRWIREAGLRPIRVHPLLFGMASIYEAQRPLLKPDDGGRRS